MSNKSNKRSMLVCAITLLLCVSMVVGSTYAWFTDAIAANDNVIQSGELKMTLGYKNNFDDAWTYLTGTTNTGFFNYKLWEPGYTLVKYFEVKNVGTLSFNYFLNITTDGADDLKLADVIDVYVADGKTEIATRADVANMNYVGTLSDVMEKEAEGKIGGFLEAINETGTNVDACVDTVAVALKMKESAGNEYQALKLDGFDLELIAVQGDAEDDSFGNDYDAEAGTRVYTANQMKEALAKGESVVLGKDIVLNETVTVSAPATTFAMRTAPEATVLNLNGYTITNATGTAIRNEGNLKIIGKGTIESTAAAYAIRVQQGSLLIDSADVTVKGAFGAVSIFNGADVTINGGNYYAAGINGMTSHTIYVSKSTLTVNGGTFDSGYSSEGIDTICGSSSTVTLNDGTFYASELGASFFLKNVIVKGGIYQYAPNAFLADGYKAVSYNGNYYVIEDKEYLVANVADLQSALAANGTAILMADVAVAEDETITVASGTTATINLNGYKISGTAEKSGNQELFLIKGNLTVKNGSMAYSTTNNQGWGSMITIFDVTAGGVLSMEEVTATVGGSDMNFIVHLNNWGSATLTVDNCDFTTTYVAIRAFNSGYDMNTVVVKNTDFHGGRVFWVHNYTTEGKDDSTLTVDIYGNGNTTDNEKPVRYGFSDSLYFDIDGRQFVSSADDLKAAIADGKSVTLTQDATLGKIDLTNAITNDVVIDANGHKITTTDSYGVEVTSGKNITISNADIVMTKAGDYITYAAGLKIANGDYAGATITLQNCTITMANTDWAYAVNMPASVKNLNLVIDNCTLKGAVAVQCWGDNNTITITNSKLICNYTTNAQYTSYCVSLQGDGYNVSENNTLVIDNCEFLYSGIDNYGYQIYSVADLGNGNTVTVTNCTYGEKVKAY